jgi:hypothetical protein
MFVEIQEIVGRAGGRACVRNMVLHIVLVGFSEIGHNLSIPVLSSYKSLFLGHVTTGLTSSGVTLLWAPLHALFSCRDPAEGPLRDTPASCTGE